ncbi:hypothetical protein [Helicobacter saguini]|nr:hypothetical protein [Helicobacter saguini]
MSDFAPNARHRYQHKNQGKSNSYHTAHKNITESYTKNFVFC